MTDVNEVPTEEVAQAALEQYQDKLLSYPNVTGVGIQDHVRPDGVVEPVVKVYVKQKLAPDELDEAELLPSELEVTVKDPAGNTERQARVGVQVEETGELDF
jgi:hypothetical protein